MPRGVLVPIIFWVCFFGFIAWSIYPHSAQQDARPSRLEDKSQKNPKAEQADNGKEQPAPQSPAFRIILKWENPDETNWSKPNCEHPQSHDEADLCEQRQTVLLNGRQVGIGILTLFGLAFTVFFAYRTAEAAIASAEHAHTAANAAQDSACASRAQISLTEKNANRELRAYIHVDNVDMLYINSTKWDTHIRVRIKNFGATPAYRVNHRGIYIIAIGGGIPEVRNIPQNSQYQTLGPSQDYTSTQFKAAWKENDAVKAAIIKREFIFYVYGEITYFDAFQDPAKDKPHFTRYRLQIEPANGGIPKDGGHVFSPEGNEAE